MSREVEEYKIKVHIIICQPLSKVIPAAKRNFLPKIYSAFRASAPFLCNQKKDLDNMDTIFLISLNKTLSNEGFINNNPKDKGGYTYKGISRENHPSWKGWRIIDSVLSSLSAAPRQIKKRVILDEVFNSNIPLNRLVEEFYCTEFWDKIQGDLLPSQLIADELFDTSVNLGVSAASEFLQHTINLLNKNGTIYPDIIVDGIIGTQTLETLTNCIAANGEKLIFNLLNIYQGKKYIEIMEHDHSQEIFIGWFTRIDITKNV